MNYVVLLAGGVGSRMKTSLPKQHICVKGKQIIEYTLTAFSNSADVDKIVIVSNKEYIAKCKELQKDYPKVTGVVEGGATRILSVYNALCYLRDFCMGDDKIIFSDAVRPCITLHEVAELYASLNNHCASTTGVELYETVLHIQNDELVDIKSRDGLLKQTSPEAYTFEALEHLYFDVDYQRMLEYKNIGIDMLFEQGKPIGIVKSTAYNFKITTQIDVDIFESVLRLGFNNILETNYCKNSEENTFHI